MVYLHDLRSAFLVRLRSLGVVRGVDAFVAVFTSDSKISSSPSVNPSSLIFNAGDRSVSGRRRLHVQFPVLSILSTDGLCTCVPNNCLK